MDIRQRNAPSVKELIGVALSILDERMTEVMLIILTFICIAAVWAMLLVWTQ